MTPPDLAILLVAAARVVSDRLGAAVADAGIDDMRAPYGYVIRALADHDRTLTDVAKLLEVTKPAAIKVIDEMESRGLLTREPHPTDRRVKVLRLTDRGRSVRRAALAESHRMEADLRRAVGDADTDALRRALLELLDAPEDAAAVHEGRARANW